MRNKAERQAAIREIVFGRPITSQAEIVEALTERGYSANQAVVSRDIREIGLVKVNGHYQPMAAVAGDIHGGAAIEDGLIIDVATAGANLIVVRTTPGAAGAVGLRLDQRLGQDVIGTIAGDDTVFVATAGARDQSRLLAAASETGIPLSSYCSVARGEVFRYPLFAEIGAGYGKSAAQVVLRWILQKGVPVTTMSTKPDNIRANYDIMDFTLSSPDLARIDAMTATGYRIVGRDLVPYAERFHDLHAEVQNRIANASRLEGRVRFAITSRPAMTWLPALMKRLERQYPLIEAEFVITNSEDMSAQLRQGELDFALMAGPVASPNIRAETVMVARLGWLASPRLSLPQRPVTPRDLLDLPVITDTRGSHLYQLAMDWFRTE
ncbi:MAG: aldo/keto reductase, partial [Phycisphaerae bacterium]|nr:aldo/keto reductase [Phycisphaerae bacterium]